MTKQSRKDKPNPTGLLRHLSGVPRNDIPSISELDKLGLEFEHSGSEQAAFSKEFQQIHSELLQELSTRYPTLTPTERKICLLLREQLSIKEMAGMMKVTTHAIAWHRNAIRKKMKLNRSESLTMALSEL